MVCLSVVESVAGFVGELAALLCLELPVLLAAGGDGLTSCPDYW